MSDNPFELPAEGEQNEDSGSSETASIKEIRAYAQRQEKAAKAAEKELNELREFRAQVTAEKREAAITTAFAEVGLSPAHAKLFKAMNPELDPEAVTAEAVAGFATEYQLPVQATGEVPPAQEPRPTGYNPVVSQSAAPLGTLTEDDVQRLMKEGRFAEVNKAYADGRVIKEDAPWRR